MSGQRRREQPKTTSSRGGRKFGGPKAPRKPGRPGKTGKGLDPKSLKDKVDFERWKIQRKKQSEKPVHPLNKFGYKKRKGMNIGGRANLLEEMGRIDARKHPDAADRAEKSRVISELNRGYNKGGRIGFKDGTKMVEIPVNKPIGRGGRMSIEKVPSGGKKHMSYLKSKTNPDSPFFVREPMKKGGLIKGKPKLAKRGWK